MLLSDAIAENVYKCELCSCLHSGQEALCNHYLIDHKVVMLFTKTEVLAGDLVEISEDQATELHSQTIGWMIQNFLVLLPLTGGYVFECLFVCMSVFLMNPKVINKKFLCG